MRMFALAAGMQLMKEESGERKEWGNMGMEFKILDYLQNIRTSVGDAAMCFVTMLAMRDDLDFIDGHTADNSKDEEKRCCIAGSVMCRSYIMQWDIKKFVCQNTSIRYKYTGSAAHCKTG